MRRRKQFSVKRTLAMLTGDPSRETGPELVEEFFVLSIVKNLTTMLAST